MEIKTKTGVLVRSVPLPSKAIETTLDKPVKTRLERLTKELIEQVLEGNQRRASVLVASQWEADRLFVGINNAAIERGLHCSDKKLRGIPFLLLHCFKLRQKVGRSKILIYWPLRLTGELLSVALGWQRAEQCLNRRAAKAPKLRKEQKA